MFKKQLSRQIGTFELSLNSSEIIWASEDLYLILGLNTNNKNLWIKDVRDCLLEEYKQKFDLQIDALRREGETFDYQFKIKGENHPEMKEIYMKIDIQEDKSGASRKSIGVIKDVTDSIKTMNKLTTSQEMYKTLYENSPFGISLTDTLTGVVYKANQKYAEITGVKIDKITKVDWKSITHPEDIQEDFDQWELMKKGKNNGYSLNKRYLRPDGSSVWVKMTVIPIVIDQIKTNRHLTFIDDITDKMNYYEEIEHASNHDSLTGLHNRRYFDAKFRELEENKVYPISVIIGDVNGLKMFNETYGHLEGDKELIRIGNKINEFIKKNDQCSRIGGDEFGIILTDYKEEQLKEISMNLEEYLNNSDPYQSAHSLSISFGYSIQKNEADSLDDLFRDAEIYMYSKKYYNKLSSRSNSINLIMNTLFAKSEREKNHSERVGDICEKIAIQMGYKTEMINKIRTAGYFHDIGKIGIDESLLNKEGMLTDSEWQMMKLHSVKSARILENTIEYHDISEIVLSHHEKFDGSGYPNGLVALEIPIEARIIAVADAYDAMTRERTYREVISHKEALEEISRCSGTQFDPAIVSAFIQCCPNC